MSHSFEEVKSMENSFLKRATILSLFIHFVLMNLTFNYSVPEMETRNDAIQVTIAPLPEKEAPKKNKALKVESPFKEAEVMKEIPKEKVIAGTEKVIPKNDTLGDKNAKVVQKVQKGDPMSKDMSKYKPGTDFRKLKATNIGAGGGDKYQPMDTKSGGSGDTYKGLDFASKATTNFAPLGGRFKVKNAADDMGAGAGKGGGIGDGNGKGFGDGSLTGTRTGTVETSKILTNVGSLTGAAEGKIGSSKGAEGLSQKGSIVLSGIPSETVVLGSIDPNAIRQLLLEHLSQFRYCYQAELESSQRPKNLTGIIHLNFTIGSEGQVQKTNIGGDQSITREIRQCVAEVLRGIEFPVPKGGGVVEVRQPMNFYPKQL